MICINCGHQHYRRMCGAALNSLPTRHPDALWCECDDYYPECWVDAMREIGGYDA